MSELFSPEVLKAELDRLPKNELAIGAEATPTDAGANVRISRDIGNSTIEADASWMRKAGYKIAAFFGYKW